MKRIGYYSAKGLKIAITSKPLPKKDIIATIKYAVKDLQKGEADIMSIKMDTAVQTSKHFKGSFSRNGPNAFK